MFRKDWLVLKKFLTVLFLVALLPICYALTAYAADTVTIDAKSYTHGKPTNIGTSTISMGKGTSVGFDIDFSVSPTEISFICSNDAKHAGPVEVHLDSIGGPILAKISTNPNVEWVRVNYTAPLTMDISGPHQIWFVFQGLSTDLVSVSFVIQDPADMYESFATQSDAFSDIADSPIRTQINILADLGILPKNREKFDAERLVSKRDFLRSVSSFYLDTVVGLQEEQLFADVTTADKDYNLIKWLCGTGVLTADPYSNLNLDGSLSFDEAIGYIIGLLEYDNEVELRGGVYQTATRLGILKGVNVSSTSDVKNKDMVKLLWNALQSKYNNTVSVSSNGLIKYKSEDDVIEYTGLVNGGEDVIYATQNSNIYSGPKAPVSCVMIDNEVYNVGKTDAAKYLGFKCIYFYEEVDGKKTLLAARPAMNIQYQNISSQDYEIEKITDDLISYYVNDREKQFRFADTAIIVYNGTKTTEDLGILVERNKKDKFNGRVLLVDNDNDNRYDVVMVDQARTIVFGGYTMDKDSTSVYDLLEMNTIEAGIDTRVILLYGVNGGSWANAKPGTVMDVYESAGVIRFVPSSETVTGTIAEISKDGNTVSVIMDDGSVYEAYDKNNSDVILGETVILKLNSFGQYVTFAKTESSKIGIVLGAGLETDGIESTARIRLLTENNEKVIFDFASRVTCDGVVCKTPEEIAGGTGKYRGFDNDNMVSSSVVLYNTNANNEIIMLDTLNKGAGGKYDILSKTFSSDSRNKITSTYIGRVDDDSTPIGVVSNSLKAVSIAKNGNEDQYKFIKYNSGKAPFDGYSTRANSVTGGPSFLTDLIVINRAGKTASNDRETHFIVTDRYERLGADGEIEIVLEGYNKSGKVTYVIDNYTLNGDVVVLADGDKVKEDYSASSELRKALEILEPGDIVQPAVDPEGLVTFLDVQYKADGSTPENYAGIGSVDSDGKEIKVLAYTDGKGGLYKGTVLNSEDGFAEVTYNGERNTYVDGNTIKILSVTIREGKVILDTVGASWLRVDEDIFVAADPYEYKPGLVVIYRK